MSSLNLLCTRIKQNWQHLYGLFKAIVDWTVLVYLVLPATVIGAVIYRSWWLQIPAWIEGIPYELIFIIFFFLFWQGHFRTFVRTADRIFLMKNERLLLGLKQGGIIYSYVLELMFASVLALLVAPFWLHHYQMSMSSLAMFALLWLSLKWLVMAVMGRKNVYRTGWWHLLRSLPQFIITIIIWAISYYAFSHENILIMMAIIIINTVVSMLLIKQRFLSVRTFEQDLAIEELEKVKYINLIFGMSMDMEKMPKLAATRKRPRLYGRSNRIFKRRTAVNGFLELFIKATTRNTEYILGYFKIVGVTVAAIAVLPPLWLKITFVLIAFLFLFSWITSVWHKVIGGHPFTKRYAQYNDYMRGKNIAIFVLIIPFIIMVICAFMIRIWIQQLFLFL